MKKILLLCSGSGKPLLVRRGKAAMSSYTVVEEVERILDLFAATLPDLEGMTEDEAQTLVRYSKNLDGAQTIINHRTLQPKLCFIGFTILQLEVWNCW